MKDLNQPEPLSEPLEPSTAITQALPRGFATAQPSEENFQAGQKRVLKMIAMNAPLSEILASLVLLIEAQSPQMYCSVLVLSKDGNHVQHAAAPSLPEEYVKGVNGSPIGPKHGSC